MDIDTSSYPRAAPVQQQNPLDTIGKLQEMQQRSIGIDRSKLQLVNEKWDFSSKALGALLNKPGLNGDDLLDTYRFLHKNRIMDDDQFAKEVSSIKTLAGVKRQYPNASPEQQEQILSQMHRDDVRGHLLAGATRIEQLNGAYGSNPFVQNTGGGYQAMHTFNGRIEPTSPVVPEGLPRTTSGFIPGQNGQPGREAPIGANEPNSPGLPFGGAQVPQQRLPIGNPPGSPSNPRSVPTVNAPALPANARPDYNSPVNPARNAQGRPNNLTGPETPIAGSPPFGLKEASTITGGESGKLLAQHRNEASNYQRTVFPLEKSIDSLEKLGTKGTGPGTDAWNNLKSFILSNVPGVTEKSFNDTVKTYDEAKKYLTDFVNQNGNTGTNDKLAAAFAGNPSVHISNAAATDVAKAAIALARMKQAQVIAFGRVGLPDSAYAKWASDNSAQWDARAFGVDKMSKKAKETLYKQLDKNPVEAALFDQSLEIAHNLGLVKLK